MTQANPSFRYLEITSIDPVKFQGQNYGAAIIFNNEKQHVKFTSKFHDPNYLPYSQIARIDVQRDPKNWLLLVGLLTLVVIIGLFLLLARAYLPPWKITLYLKNGSPVIIRARLTDSKVDALLNYPQVPVNLLKSKEKRNTPLNI